MARTPAADVKATDVLANERTFLAYVRTALAFIGFGFVVARFGIYVEQLSSVMHVKMPGPHYSALFGSLMAIMGVLIGALGGWRYATADTALRAGLVKSLPRVWAYIVTLFLALIGLTVAIYFSNYR